MNSKNFFAVVAIFAGGFLAGHFVEFSPLENSPTEIIAETPAEDFLDDSAVLAKLDTETFDAAWKIVEEKFVDVEKLDSQKMFYGAIKGVVESLGDSHSEFLDPEESAQFLDSLEGELTGIGAEIGMRDEILTVISPLRDSPAERAGLLPGDKIYKIADEYAADFTVFEAVRKIRGEIDTEIILTIFRGDELSPREIKITRELITIESVHSEVRDDGIAVVTVNNFADNTADEFAAALADLSVQNPRGVILDLRFNGGGFLDAAIAMASNLLPSGNVVQIHERGKTDATISVIGAAILPETPLVVLINEGSASASEILAGALQDSARATVLGETSFGKGTVQELISDFRDGSTLRITVAKWFTPAGRDVDGVGLEPDIFVAMPIEDYFTAADPQLDAAIEFLNTGKVEISGEEI